MEEAAKSELLAGRYERPVVVDHGSLVTLTQSHLIMAGSQFANFGAGFAASVLGPGNTVGPPGTPSGPLGGMGNLPGGGTGQGTPSGPLGGMGNLPGGGTGQPPVNVPTVAHHHVHVPNSFGGSPVIPGSGKRAAGGEGGAGSSGGTLPFTGFAVALSAGIGLALASAGQALRRVSRR